MMEQVILLTLFLSLTPVAQHHDDRDLSLSISVVEGEHSKDSNSSSTTITLKDNNLLFDRSYTGYRASKRKPSHQEIELTEQEIDQLKRLISKERLLVSRATQLPTGDTGRYIIVTMNLRMGNRKAEIKVSGMTGRIENETLYKAARALINEIDRIRDAPRSSISSSAQLSKIIENALCRTHVR